MLSARLIQMIEDHAEELTRGLIHDLKTNKLTTHYHHMPDSELRERAYDVYRHLGDWVSHETEGVIDTTFSALGQRRFSEGVPLSEVIWALTLTKYHLRDYIHYAGLMDTAVELHQHQELRRLVGHFFDRAIYGTVCGYERESAAQPAKVSHAA